MGRCGFGAHGSILLRSGKAIADGHARAHKDFASFLLQRAIGALGKLSNSRSFAVQLASHDNNRPAKGRTGPKDGIAVRRLRSIVLLSCLALLGGCKAVVLDPSGDVAIQQRDALLDSVWLMLLVIVPVMALTVLFAWHYRKSNTSARYEPDWDHSTQLELVIWGLPCSLSSRWVR